MMTPVAAIDRKNMLVILDDGRTAPFVEMYDENGDETEDIASACTVVAEHPDGAWMVLDLDYFDGVTKH